MVHAKAPWATPKWPYHAHGIGNHDPCALSRHGEHNWQLQRNGKGRNLTHHGLLLRDDVCIRVCVRLQCTTLSRKLSAQLFLKYFYFVHSGIIIPSMQEVGDLQENGTGYVLYQQKFTFANLMQASDCLWWKKLPGVVRCRVCLQMTRVHPMTWMPHRASKACWRCNLVKGVLECKVMTSQWQCQVGTSDKAYCEVDQ